MSLRRLAADWAHNCVAHRLLFWTDPLAALRVDRAPRTRLARMALRFHDWTATVAYPCSAPVIATGSGSSLVP
jgi:hypothetical protein